MTTQAAEDPVLIVGAGPTGLTLGIELRRRGVACRVVDRLVGPVTTSRSFTLHARTLELFEIAGIAARFLERGSCAVSMDYHFKGTAQAARLDFSQLPSRYPFMLIINQNVTEQVLRDQLVALGTAVEWATELRSLSPEPDGRLSALLIHQPSGREEIVRTRWLVGADGVQSTVRAQLDIPYEGDEYTGMQMRMMDVALRGFPLEDDRIHYFISTARLLLVTKLPGANYRVLISDMQDTPSTSTQTARSAFQDALDEHFRGSVSLGEPEWATVFRIWKRVTPRYRHGGVFLAGDAAHCHSPAGGQGMNVCVQDAFNLGWKLALVCAGEAGESLLDTYERERRPIAQQVIEGTNALHSIIMAHGTSVEDRIALSREPGFTQQAISKISGLAYHYRDAAKPTGSLQLGGLAAGDRAPDTRLDPGLRLHDLLRHERHTLLLTSTSGGAALEGLVGDLTRRFGTWLRVEVLAPAHGDAPGLSSAIAAESDDAALSQAAAEGEMCCLVRPDGYLAMRGRFTDAPALCAALTGYLW